MKLHRGTRTTRLLIAGAAIASVTMPLSAGGTALAAENLCGPPADTVPPQVSSLTIDPQTVDLGTGHASVTITAHATDTTSGAGTGSGVKRFSVEARGPRSWVGAALKLTSGTPQDGTWTGTLNVPTRSKAGTWKLEDAYLSDADNNGQEYDLQGSHPSGPNDIRLQPGWDTTFTTTGTSPTPVKQPTVKAAALTGFRMSPNAVNTTQAPARVAIHAYFSGGRLPRDVNLNLEGKSGKHHYYRNSRLKAGNDGIFAAHLTIPRGLGSGTASARVFAGYARNVSPGYRSYSATALHKLHYNSAITVTSTRDTTKPVLTNFTLTPGSVDTTASAQTVAVSATATDDLSGVDRLSVDLRGPQTSRYRFGGYDFVHMKRQGSTWTGTAKFPQCSAPGLWQASVYVNDKVDNSMNYSTAKLTAAGFASSVAVTSTKGDTDPPYVTGATASGIDHTITVDFSEGVKNVSSSTLGLYALEPAATRYQHTTSPDAMTCSDGSTVVDCSGASTLVTSVELSVPALDAGTKYALWANQNAVTPQLTDGADNPIEWNSPIAKVTGS